MTIRSDSTRQRIFGQDARRPRSVVARQGQVLLDADLDQQARLQLDRIETETRDVLGPPDRLMVRAGNDGFKLTLAGQFSIGAGWGYLGGWLLDNAAACTLATQPHPRTDPTPARYVLALKALVRHVDPVEEPAWADIALGDAQASGRALNDWQAFVFVPDAGGALSCADLLARPDWQKLVEPSSGQLAIVPQQASPSTNPCSLTPAGGYARLENLLYRIEVDGGVARADHPNVDGPRFGVDGLVLKFSRRNASVLARVTAIDGGSLTVAAAPLDPANWFAPGSFAEIVSVNDDLDPRGALSAKRMFKVASAVDTNVTLEANGAQIAATKLAADGTWFLRLWDSFPGGDGVATTKLAGGGSETDVVDLGDGLGVKLSGGAAAIFRRGDYWLCPARADGSIDWPLAGGAYKPQAPHGPDTRYAPLAVIGGDQGPLEDCRVPFASLSDRALLYRGGDGQSLFANGVGIGFLPLPAPLRVAVLRGETPVPNAQVVWSVPKGKPDSQVNGKPVTANKTVTVKTDSEGLCQVTWAIDAGKQLVQHVVQAALATGPGAKDPPIVFGATFETARKTGYDPGKCKHLVGTTNVQDAIDGLCAAIDQRRDCLSLTRIQVGGVKGTKLQLIQKNMILNGADVAADSLADGIAFDFDKRPLGCAPQPFDPIVEVELDIPYPATEADKRYWALEAMGPKGGLSGPFGFQRLRLDGSVSLAGEKESRGDLVWRPSPPAQMFLARLGTHFAGQRVFDAELAAQLKREAWVPEPGYARLACRIRLRSALIWAGDGNKRLYLNAECLGTRSSFTGRELQLTDRDDQRAADLDMFVYLVVPTQRTGRGTIGKGIVAKVEGAKKGTPVDGKP